MTETFGINLYPSEPTYTAAEVKVLTEDACKVAAEAGRRIGRAEAGREIEAACEADTFYDVAARYHFARIARSISRQPPGATPEPQTASPGSSGYPQDSKAATEPQEPCEDPECPVPLMHTHPWLSPTHQPLGIRSTEAGPFVRCSCGENPTPKHWIEDHWPGDKVEGRQLVEDLIAQIRELT